MFAKIVTLSSTALTAPSSMRGKLRWKKRVNTREEGVCVKAQPELVERRKIERKRECGKEREPTIWQYVGK